jgi:bacteriophage HK97-gp10 putative tail-component
MTLISKRKEVSAALESGTKDSLKEIAGEAARQIKDRLKEGFTSGDFVTGDLAKSVQVSEVFGEKGEWTVEVGTDNLLALYWELGHHNLFTRKYERVEVWRPIMFQFQSRALDIVARTLKSRVNGNY